MARGMDSEAGGAADLQTDVMRFMAILSLCLMVIFALVQSVPVETAPITVTMPTPAPPPPQTKPDTSLETKAEVPPPIEQVPVEAPTPQPLAKTIQPTPAPAPTPAPPETKEGFTLRFETDQALNTLVARNEIGLYAITDGNALRMTINQDKAEFWSASLPRQYHEMDAATVPEAVIRALQLSTNSSASSTQWGVTLPSVMSGKLRTYMQDYRGGSLVIGADGILRMEP